MRLINLRSWRYSRHDRSKTSTALPRKVALLWQGEHKHAGNDEDHAQPIRQRRLFAKKPDAKEGN